MDRYTLVEMIGAGAFGRVYRAEVRGDMGFVSDFAVKVLDASVVATNPNVARQMADEARILSQLDHPNIVKVIDFKHVDHPVLGDVFFMVLEFVRGIDVATLHDRIRQANRWVPAASALHLGLMVSDALAHAHELSGRDGQALCIVHRDLKPQNLMINFRGQVKVLDFGIAKAKDNRLAARTQEGQTKGTVFYMSPEQLTGDELDGRADVYSLAAILYELLLGRRLLDVEVNTPADLARAMHTAFELDCDARLEELRAHLGRGNNGRLSEEAVEGWIALLRQALQKDPRYRPDSARTFAEQLEWLRSRMPPAEDRDYWTHEVEAAAGGRAPSVVSRRGRAVEDVPGVQEDETPAPATEFFGMESGPSTDEEATAVYVGAAPKIPAAEVPQTRAMSIVSGTVRSFGSDAVERVGAVSPLRAPLAPLPTLRPPGAPLPPPSSPGSGSPPPALRDSGEFRPVAGPAGPPTLETASVASSAKAAGAAAGAAAKAANAAVSGKVAAAGTAAAAPGIASPTQTTQRNVRSARAVADERRRARKAGGPDKRIVLPIAAALGLLGGVLIALPFARWGAGPREDGVATEVMDSQGETDGGSANAVGAPRLGAASESSGIRIEPANAATEAGAGAESPESAGAAGASGTSGALPAAASSPGATPIGSPATSPESGTGSRPPATSGSGGSSGSASTAADGPPAGAAAPSPAASGSGTAAGSPASSGSSSASASRPASGSGSAASPAGATPAAAGGGAASSSASESGETGMLHLSARPRCTVEINGKSYGTTDETRRGLRLPAGTYKVRFVCDDAAECANFKRKSGVKTLIVEPGKETRYLADFYDLNAREQ
jgi:serine/threonine protein kinase